MADESFIPRDTLSLWWLGDPAQPRPVGEARLVQGGRGVALRYGEAWLAKGFALSEDLPLTRALFLPSERDSAAGALDDARPDRWGERLIRKFHKSPRLSLMEYLLFAGDDRYGALGLSLEEGSYRPWPGTPLPEFADLPEMAEAVRRVLADESVDERHQRLVRPGASLGGARPKSLLRMDGRDWLVKFNEEGEGDMALVEHAAMRLAARCGIEVAPTRPLPLAEAPRPGRAASRAVVSHAIAIERFDRQGPLRLQAMSVHVALRAAGEPLGYPEFAQLLRRLLPAGDIAPAQAQLFRRMVFNILIDNTDDHEKNHALLRLPDGRWQLAPAFDVLPTAQGLGYQQLRVGSDGHAATLANALSECGAFGLRLPAARAIVRDLSEAVGAWQTAFAEHGVTPSDIERLAPFIDRERLRSERERAARA